MIQTDYLIVGSGAVGMAFADTLLSETDANIVIVDRYPKPGGHWNVAYPFVTLHQPSQFYGVNSKELSHGHIDKVGWNKGLNDLATGAEVSAYFDQVMRHTFLPSGRVKYFPLCEYTGNHEFESILTGEKFTVEVKNKLVDCTYLNTSVPATHTPNFEIDEGVQFIPLNDLPKIKKGPADYVIIGGGKTGIDACLWLLENHVDPAKITWIVSRDAWLINRENTQSGEEFFESTIGGIANELESIAHSTSISDLFSRLEKSKVLFRLDPTVEPKMFHGATVSEMELEQLRRINNIVRLGRVKKLGTNKIVLDKGEIETSPNHVHVDCSAIAIPEGTPKTIFTGDVITPQTVRAYQPVFSASAIAFVEAHYKNDDAKNKLCQVVELPNHETSWITMKLKQMVNQFTWSKDKKLKAWLATCRLDGAGALVRNFDRTDEKKMTIMNRIRKYSMPAMIKLQQYVSEIEEVESNPSKNLQFQVRRNLFFTHQTQEIPKAALEIEEGEILVSIKKFAYTSNNITYAVAGDMIGYWNFFPPIDDTSQTWGVIPVWGFAEVVQSNVDEISVGEKLFGYFPPASHLKLKPVKISDGRFIDATEHRAALPSAYNLYRRVLNERGYNPDYDNERMVLFPLHLTAYCIWDSLQDKDWYGAEQIIILSASSKTSTGLAYALDADNNAPKVIGVTSERNLETVKNLGIYGDSLTYENIDKIANIPTVIVDMSGNAKIMVALHTALADNMKFTINVGLTHWSDAKPQPGIISERSEFFFAPGHMSKRIKEWGPAEFDKKTASFLMDTADKTKSWLKFEKINGIQGLAEIHADVCVGKIAPDRALVVEME